MKNLNSVFCCKLVVLEKGSLIFQILMNVGHFGTLSVKIRGLLLSVGLLYVMEEIIWRLGEVRITHYFTLFF